MMETFAVKGTVYPSAKSVLTHKLGCRVPDYIQRRRSGKWAWSLYWSEGGAELTLYQAHEGPQEMEGGIKDALQVIGGDQPVELNPGTITWVNALPASERVQVLDDISKGVLGPLAAELEEDEEEMDEEDDEADEEYTEDKAREDVAAMLLTGGDMLLNGAELDFSDLGGADLDMLLAAQAAIAKEVALRLMIQVHETEAVEQAIQRSLAKLDTNTRANKSKGKGKSKDKKQEQ